MTAPRRPVDGAPPGVAPLFTPRFLTMFGYSVAVFASLFQLLPVAPYRVLALGGTTAEAGLFLGVLTYACALSAPFTGPLSDRLGHRAVLVGVSGVLALITGSYAFIGSYRLLLGVVLLHGVVWSALLSASGAYMTATIPPSRRAEGLGYWGLASILAIGIAPAIGFWVYRSGWSVLCLELVLLNLLMAVIAWILPDDPVARDDETNTEEAQTPPTRLRNVLNRIEWRVLVLSGCLALVTFGYGALTSFSALFADALGVMPRSLFLTGMAATVTVGRLVLGPRLDQIEYRRVLAVSLTLPAVGLLLLALAGGWLSFLAAGLVFGVGFGLVYPSYTAYVLAHVDPARRGGAFGAMLAAFDAGIGTGSSLMGWLLRTQGFRVGFMLAALLAALSLPYFLVARRRLGFEPAAAVPR